MGTRLLGGFVAVSVLVLATACGGGGGGTPAPQDTSGASAGLPTPAPGTTPKPANAAGTCTPGAMDGAKQVNITGAHDVDQTQYTISAGAAVTWNNQSTTNHQIFFDAGPDCGILTIGKSISIKFTTPGSYSWVDHIYPTYIKGTITVQ
ncbi:MAG TPA: hypothetical protein VIK08_07645 [Candidatus Limnocylindrales bacterium]